MTTALLKAFAWIVRILLATFFAFVGYWKAFGPVEALAEHHAWVAGFPVWFARSVGVSELAFAVMLLLPARFDQYRLVVWSAGLLFANQLAALAVHLARGEAAQAAPQNIVLLVLLALVAGVQVGAQKDTRS